MGPKAGWVVQKKKSAGSFVATIHLLPCFFFFFFFWKAYLSLKFLFPQNSRCVSRNFFNQFFEPWCCLSPSYPFVKALSVKTNQAFWSPGWKSGTKTIQDGRGNMTSYPLWQHVSTKRFSRSDEVSDLLFKTFVTLSICWTLIHTEGSEVVWWCKLSWISSCGGEGLATSADRRKETTTNGSWAALVRCFGLFV